MWKRNRPETGKREGRVAEKADVGSNRMTERNRGGKKDQLFQYLMLNAQSRKYNHRTYWGWEHGHS